MPTMSDDSMSHFKVLIVRTVITSSSSAMVVSDAWEFFEKNAEVKEVKFSLCFKQVIFHEGTTNLRDYLLKVHPLRCEKKRKRSSEL